MIQDQVTYSLAVQRQDGGYLAHFPALPGCVTWGTTYEEAVNNAREALTVYLESLDTLGKPLPATDEIEGTVSLGITVRMPVIS
jgi:predicted RNase H-like HicB family nuclease